MKSFFICLAALIPLCLLAQSTKTVVINVDVLGRKYETVRYYHPVNGAFAVSDNKFFAEKELTKVIENCLYINPLLGLKDSINFIQANSLRHYVDPSELIYIDWQMGRDTLNLKKIEGFKEESKGIRINKYQQLINFYFQPFYFRKVEVTNNEYRDFVHWVRDSIFKEAVYASDEFSDDEVYQMLNFHSEGFYSEVEGYVLYRDMEREVNRSLFSFKQDFDIRKEFTDERLKPILYEYYLHPNERWYKRKEIDVTKLKYKYVVSKNKSNLDWNKNWDPLVQNFEQLDINVYPDTGCWVSDASYTYNDPFINMNFWHPAYDNYPVSGVSWQQAKAFLHWKQKQFENEHPEFIGLIEFDLPRMYEYEWAVTHSFNNDLYAVLQDDKLLTDLLLDNSEGKFGQFHELLSRNQIPFTQKVFLPYNICSREGRKWFKRYLKSNHLTKADTTVFYAMLNMRAAQNFLAGGIRFLSNNLSEWMADDYQNNYADLIEAYINYNCFASIDYCEDQRKIDNRNNQRNDKDGKLIMGANWLDERYEMLFNVNVGGLYPKLFKSENKAYSTVGFRYVVRLKPQ